MSVQARQRRQGRVERERGPWRRQGQSPTARLVHSCIAAFRSDHCQQHADNEHKCAAAA